MLKRNYMVPGDRPIIAIGYKYNTRKVLYFIAKTDAGSTNSGIPYLSKYTDQISNVFICPVACPLVMSNLFGSVNEVVSHNKSRQSDLALEEYWVTQFGWLLLCATVAMGMTIAIFWKLFHYGVK